MAVDGISNAFAEVGQKRDLTLQVRGSGVSNFLVAYTATAFVAITVFLN